MLGEPVILNPRKGIIMYGQNVSPLRPKQYPGRRGAVADSRLRIPHVYVRYQKTSMKKKRQNSEDNIRALEVATTPKSCVI
jgi:hypothetical protein